MSAQEGEILILDGKREFLASYPLLSCDEYKSKQKQLVWRSTDNKRGYIGTWKVKDNKLYLVDLHGWVKGNEEIGIEFFFEGKQEVFAKWYSGALRIPRGKALKYVHSGFSSKFEYDEFLEFKNGYLIDTQFVMNRNHEAI